MSCKNCDWPIFDADEELLCVECNKQMNDDLANAESDTQTKETK